MDRKYRNPFDGKEVRLFSATCAGCGRVEEAMTYGPRLFRTLLLMVDGWVTARRKVDGKRVTVLLCPACAKPQAQGGE